MFAIAVTSSLLTVASSSSLLNRLVISWTMMTSGHISMVRKEITDVTKPIRFFQYVVPIVFGTISENTSTSNVVNAEMIPNQVLPNKIVAWRPTAAAPRVFAIVFNDRIAASGLSGSDLNLKNFSAGLYPCSFFIVMNESGVDINTDSRREQRNETPSVPSI